MKMPFNLRMKPKKILPLQYYERGKGIRDVGEVIVSHSGYRIMWFHKDVPQALRDEISQGLGIPVLANKESK